jgi:hypothetical protein
MTTVLRQECRSTTTQEIAVRSGIEEILCRAATGMFFIAGQQSWKRYDVLILLIGSDSPAARVDGFKAVNAGASERRRRTTVAGRPCDV